MPIPAFGCRSERAALGKFVIVEVEKHVFPALSEASPVSHLSSPT